MTGDSQIAAKAARGRSRDRLSKLGDGVLGHVLSFLDAREAARTAALSSRWRDVFAAVHTVSLEEPLSDGGSGSRRPFECVVTAALLARSRRPAPAAAPTPLRALRVAMRRCYRGSPMADQWVAYALQHAAPELDLALRLDLHGPTGGSCPGRRAAAAIRPPDKDLPLHAVASPDSDDTPLRPEADDDEDDDDVASSADEERRAFESPDREYTVQRGLFSCAALRSLRLAFCKLCTPPEAAAISLPSLSELHLSNILDDAGEESVQRLVSACPRLADLTLEHCDTIPTLSLLRNTRLRSLAVRCCHELTSLAVDAPELRRFEHRGAVPDNASFLAIRSAFSVASCRLDICGGARSEDPEQLGGNLASLLQPFAPTAEHLELACARMAGSPFARLPELPRLRSLHLSGVVPHDAAHDLDAATISGVLRRAPGLETLTLLFERQPVVDDDDDGLDNEGDYLDAHHLRYGHYDALDAPAAAIPACLGSTVRRINLVHYQGGRAQRTLARFLLRNAMVLEKLYCGFAEGPLWVQTQLVREMQGWVVNVNEKASKEFR